MLWIAALVFITFVLLKAFELIDWSWWVVMVPLVVPLFFFAVVMAGVLWAAKKLDD